MPTANFFGKIIDCRYLVLEGKFFCLREEESRGLIDDFCSFIEAKLGETSIILWKQNERTLNDRVKSDSISFPKNGFYTIEFYGDQESGTVFDNKSLRSYERALNKDPLFSMLSVPSFASVDYSETAKKIIDNSTPTSLRNSLLQLFSIEGKINKNLLQAHDMHGYLIISEMIEKPKLYSGELTIRISTFCADNSIDSLSEILLSFGTMLSLKYTSVNLSINIRQSFNTSDYLRYFGNLIENNIVNQDALVLKERAKYMYLQDVGWANIVSPTVCQLISEPTNNYCTQEKLMNNALVVRAKDCSSNTSIAVLKEIKKVIYAALFPGESSFPRNWPYWRAYWENIPVLDDELDVSNSMVQFKYNGGIDSDYIFSL